MVFECDKCGICCKLIGGIPQLAAFDRGDGVCIHLRADNRCAIYESRPDICNVEKMYVFFREQMTEDEYLRLMTESCRCLKERNKISSAEK